MTHKPFCPICERHHFNPCVLDCTPSQAASLEALQASIHQRVYEEEYFSEVSVTLYDLEQLINHQRKTDELHNALRIARINLSRPALEAKNDNS